MTTTPRLNLTKIDPTDTVAGSLTTIDGNYDLLDSSVATLQDVSSAQASAATDATTKANAAQTAATVGLKRWRKRNHPPLSLIDSVMTAPPTIGALATTSAIASGVSWKSVTTSAGTTGVVNGTLFTYWGGAQFSQIARLGAAYPDYNYVVANSLTDPVTNGRGPYCVGFYFDGTALEIMGKGAAGALRIRVDGQLVDINPTIFTANGSTYYLPVTFASRAVRRITLEGSGSFAFGGVVTGPNDTITKADVRGPRCIVIGDSFTDGTGATGSTATGWVRKFASVMGWPDTWSLGVGGTGYLNAGTGGRTTFRGRVVADCINQSPDVVVFAGGINDSGADATAMLTECTTLFQQVKAALPNALIIVLSPFWRNGVSTFPATILPVRDSIKSAALAAGALFIDLLEQPIDAAPAGTVQAGVTSNVSSLTCNTLLPERATIEIGTGTANVERRVVTAVAGASSPYTIAFSPNTTNAHSVGETVKVVGGALWTGTGKVGATTGSGNSDLLVSNDGTHPSQAGHDEIGVVTAIRVYDQLPA